MLTINQFDVCQRGLAHLYYASVMSEPSTEFLKSQVLIYEAMIEEIVRKFPTSCDEYSINLDVVNAQRRIVGLKSSIRTILEFLGKTEP